MHPAPAFASNRRINVSVDRQGLPEDVFSKVLEYAARSLRQHGFIDIALIGDSGDNQAGGYS